MSKSDRFFPGCVWGAVVAGITNHFLQGLIAHFGGPDEHGDIPDGMLNFINMCQDNIDLIIKSGYFKETTK